MRRAAEEMRGGIGRRVAAAERKVVAAARRGVRGGLSEVAEKRIRAALLEIAELPAAAPSGGGDDEASLAARRLMNVGGGGAPGISGGACAGVGRGGRGG